MHNHINTGILFCALNHRKALVQNQSVRGKRDKPVRHTPHAHVRAEGLTLSPGAVDAGGITDHCPPRWPLLTTAAIPCRRPPRTHQVSPTGAWGHAINLNIVFCPPVSINMYLYVPQLSF